ncbi:MAG: ribonuclease III, partial [Bacillota bacterium]
MTLRELEAYFNLNFNNQRLLKTALTHSSYANEHHTESNERLEFVGDAVLDLIMAKYLYEEDRHYNEGDLTKRRARYVYENALVRYARACNLGKYLLLGRGEEKSGGRERRALLADAFEAFIGAIFLDKGLDEVYKVAEKVVFPEVKKDDEMDFTDFKSHLQELVQSDKRQLVYKVISEDGPSHNKTFTVRVYMDEILMGEGKGNTKKQAEQNAAELALK